MDLNLDSLLQESANVAGTLSQTHDQITAITQQGTEINQRRQQLATDAAAAAQIKTTVEVGEVARQEAARKAIAARYGTDPTIAGSFINQKAEEIREADVGIRAAAARIREKDSISFIQNPLGWIAAQVTVNNDIADYNYFAKIKNNAEDTAQALAKTTSDAFQISNALSSTTSDTYVGAMKVLSAYQFNTQALDAAAQGARWNMEGIIAATNADRDRLSVLYNANTAIMHEKQYKVELERLRISMSELNIRKEELALRKEAHNEKMHEDTLILKYIQDGYFNFTGKQMDPTTSAQALILYKAKQPDIVGFFNSGLASAKVTGGVGSGKPVISLSPYEASNYVAQGKVTNMSPAMTQVGEQLVTWRREFENPAVQNAYPYDPKDKSSKEAAFNKFVDDKKKQVLGSVSPDSVFAPYPIDQVAKINKNLGALPIWKNVLEPASKTGVNVNDPNIAFGIVTAAMKEGKLSYVDAADLSLLYAGGLDLNNQTRNFLAFGLGPVRTYNTSISIPGTLGKTAVNLADQKSFATALNRAESQLALTDAVRSQQEGVTPRMPNMGKPTGPDYPAMTADDLPRFGSRVTYPGNEEERLRNLRGQ